MAEQNDRGAGQGRSFAGLSELWQEFERDESGLTAANLLAAFRDFIGDKAGAVTEEAANFWLSRSHAQFDQLRRTIQTSPSQIADMEDAFAHDIARLPARVLLSNLKIKTKNKAAVKYATMVTSGKSVWGFRIIDECLKDYNTSPLRDYLAAKPKVRAVLHNLLRKNPLPALARANGTSGWADRDYATKNLSEFNKFCAFALSSGIYTKQELKKETGTAYGLYVKEGRVITSTFAAFLALGGSFFTFNYANHHRYMRELDAWSARRDQEISRFGTETEKDLQKFHDSIGKADTPEKVAEALQQTLKILEKSPPPAAPMPSSGMPAYMHGASAGFALLGAAAGYGLHIAYQRRRGQKAAIGATKLLQKVKER